MYAVESEVQEETLGQIGRAFLIILVAALALVLAMVLSLAFTSPKGSQPDTTPRYIEEVDPAEAYVNGDTNFCDQYAEDFDPAEAYKNRGC